MAHAVNGEENLLDDLLDPVGPAMLREDDGPNIGHDLPQQPLISGAVAVLRRRHQPRPTLIPLGLVTQRSSDFGFP